MRSLSIGFLGGVVCITDLKMTTKNTHLQVGSAAVVLRYWLTTPRHEKAVGHGPGQPQFGDLGKAPLKSRLEANLTGVNYVILNNRYARAPPQHAGCAGADRAVCVARDLADGSFPLAAHPAVTSYAYDDLEAIKRDIERSARTAMAGGGGLGGGGGGGATDGVRSSHRPALTRCCRRRAADTSKAQRRGNSSKPATKSANGKSTPEFVPPLLYKIMPFCEFNVANCDVLIGSYKLPVMLSASVSSAKSVVGCGTKMVAVRRRCGGAGGCGLGAVSQGVAWRQIRL